MKRLASPRSVTPPRKRGRVSGDQEQFPSAKNFDDALYDELILSIFSYLSYNDLCNVQRINTNWSRLSLDNQLWRNLYLREFGGSRLRGYRGSPASSTNRMDGKQIRALPSRAQGQRDQVKDWKGMFRISCNWRTGRSCTEQEIVWPDQEDPDLPVHAALVGGIMITASPLPCPSPQILVHTPDHPIQSFSSTSILPNPYNKITAMALDQSQPIGTTHRLAVFYSMGNFCLFLISVSSPKESMEISSYVPTTRRQRMASIMQAAYHHPLLITLSTSFDLSIYEIPSQDRGTPPLQIGLKQTVTSFTSYPPASLALSSPSLSSYKLVLAYSVPIYPSHWTVAVTELTISSFTVQSTQSTTPFDFDPGWSPLTPGLSETLRDNYSRKLSHVSSSSTDGKYVVLAGSATNSIQLYRLSSRTRGAGPRLTFVRTLHGHLSPVQALSVADGRCVSLSRDGSLWVWELDREGVEVKSNELNRLPGSAKVLFDERRILIILNGRIIIRRFDV